MSQTGTLMPREVLLPIFYLEIESLKRRKMTKYNQIIFNMMFQFHILSVPRFITLPSNSTYIYELLNTILSIYKEYL